jgi:hypothetical protein
MSAIVEVSRRLTGCLKKFAPGEQFTVLCINYMYRFFLHKVYKKFTSWNKEISVIGIEHVLALTCFMCMFA